MRSAFRQDTPTYPFEWDELPVGEAMQKALSQVCDEFSQRIFGYYFVKLGNLSSQITLPKCQIRQQIHYTQTAISGSHVMGHSHSLPFQENAIDGFLLANELDFAQDPHQVLREVDRTITGSGYVIITGFNPLSLAGLVKYSPFKPSSPLKEARFFSVARIKDWLHLLGFEIVEQQYLLPSTLFFSSEKSVMRQSKWVNTYLPWTGSMYVILARKREFPMTLVKPKWKMKPRFSAVGASARQIPS